MFGIKKRKHKIFAQYEFLLILGILAVLAIMICLVLDPSRQFVQARNEQRYQSVYAIFAALASYKIDHQGALPIDLAAAQSDVYYVLGSGSNGQCLDKKCQAVKNSDDCLDLSQDLVDAYLAKMPIDPLFGSSGDSGYYVKKDNDNKIIVGSCHGEQTTRIELSQ
ncbi:MAG: hypothetical protein WCX71_05350 [Candidatus Buchananbacteria bacterium]